MFTIGSSLLPMPKFYAEDFVGAHEQTIERGEVLFFQGDRHDGNCFCLLEGEMVVKLLAPDGSETLLYRLHAGDMVGELGALGMEERSATVEASTRCRLINIPASLFQQKLDDCLFVRRILALALQRYYRSHQVIQRLGLGSVTLRMCQYLSMRLEEKGASERSVRLSLPSHAELASTINCRRETITRVIRQLADQGVLSSEGSGIYRIDRERLETVLREGE